MSTAAVPAKASTSSKYDAQILTQLERAQRRIRTLDLTASLLVLAAGTLAYVSLVAVLDNALQLPVWVLRLAFGGYLLAAGVYTALGIIRPLFWRINPYYAARKVEGTVDGSKNSVINWLDLHEEQLPPAIRASLGQRAARDVGQANIDAVASVRRVSISGVVTGALFVVLLVLLFNGYLRNFGRSFAFGETPFVAQTQLTIVKPSTGDTTVAIGEAFNVEVQVDGKVPEAGRLDSLRLLLRYGEGEGYQERPLEKEELRKWSLTVPAYQVKNGFWYKVVGGDGTTPEYRVDVRAAALIDVERLLITYHYRDYLYRKVDRVQRRERKIEDFKGTKVTLEVPTNRKLSEAWVEFQPTQGKPVKINGDIDRKDPQRFLASWVLDQDGQYTLHFVSKEGERFKEVLSHLVIARLDRAPLVEIKQPGMDIELSVNGLLKLEAVAWDDVGVQALTLKMKVVDGPALADRPYRSEKELKFTDGGYPLVLDYKDAVDLTKLKGAAGQAVELKEGMTLEYWLEASDNCDLPAPNVGESKHFRVKLIEADKDTEKLQQDRAQADQELQQHQKDQDEKLKKENQARKQNEQKKKTEAEEHKQQAQPNKEQKPEPQQPDKKPENPKDGGKDKKPDPEKDKKTDPMKDPMKDPMSQEPPPERQPEDPNRTEQQKKDQEKKDEETRKRAEELKKSLEKDRAEQEKKQPKQEPPKQEEQKGQGKSDKNEPKPGQGKDDPGKKESGKDAPRKPDEGKQGQGKGAPDKQEPHPNPTKKPEDGKPQEGKNEGKPQGQPMMDGGKPGAEKSEPMEGTMPGDKPGEAKPEGNPKQQPSQEKTERGEGKQGGTAMKEPPMPGAPQPGEEKSGTPGMDKEQGKSKDGDPMMGGAKDQPGQAKGQPEKKEDKGSSKEPGDQQTARGEPKQGDPKEMTGPKDPGQDKGTEPMGQTGEKPAQAKEEKPTPKPGQSGDLDNKPGEKATREEVEKAIQDLKSADPKTREEARKKLEQAAQNAKEEQARKDAEKELEKQGRPNEDRQPGATKPSPSTDKTPENKENQPSEKSKEGQGMGESGPGAGKQGEQGPPGMGKAGQGKGEPAQAKPGMGEPMTPGMGDPMMPPDKGTPADKGTPQGQAKNQWGDLTPSKDPGKGGGALPGSTDPTKPKEPVADKADPRHKEHAGNLQLKGMNDEQKKKVLKDAGFKNEAEYNEFMKAYQQMVEREAQTKKEQPTTPGQPLQTTGPREVKKTEGTTNNGGGTLAQPPVEYRDAYQEFTRKLAEMQQRRDRK